MKSLLSLIYAVRALVVLVFVFAPKTSTTMLIFAAAIGFTYLSTVPPTAGLVARNYDWMWWADIVLAVGAALAHLPIDEKRQALAAQPA